MCQTDPSRTLMSNKEMLTSHLLCGGADCGCGIVPYSGDSVGHIEDTDHTDAVAHTLVAFEQHTFVVSDIAKPAVGQEDRVGTVASQ